jgi:hypothetical protein
MAKPIMTAAIGLLSSALAAGQVGVRAHSDIAPPSEYARHYDGSSDPNSVPWAWAMWEFIQEVASHDDEFLHDMLKISKNDSAMLAQRASTSMASLEASTKRSFAEFCSNRSSMKTNVAAAEAFAALVSDREEAEKLRLASAFDAGLPDDVSNRMRAFVQKEVRERYHGIVVDTQRWIADPRTDLQRFLNRACGAAHTNNR